MKHPFWIVNSALLFLFMAALLFMYVSRVSVPEQESLEPREYIPHKKEALVAINISKIYENDLFGTYVKESEELSSVPLPRMPEPPKPQIIPAPKAPEPQFVDPLDITLKGIVVLSSEESKNQAIIEDNKTKKESSYRVGDLVEDAQLIRIFSNKIILLRSNGQQEVLYLREQDAQLDPVYAQLGDWHEAVQEIGSHTFAINQQALLTRVKNLAQFIDLIGLTTAYKSGQSIGCRVGQLERSSLGSALGLESGDIILTINDIPTATTQERLQIYKSIIVMEEDDKITLSLLRKNNEIEITYVLKEFKKEEDTPQAKQQAEQEKIKMMQEKYKFSPTIEELRRQEKQSMFNHGKAPHTAMPLARHNEENNE